MKNNQSIEIQWYWLLRAKGHFDTGHHLTSHSMDIKILDKLRYKCKCVRDTNLSTKHKLNYM